MNLLQKYIDDIKIEAIKFSLQLSVPHSEHQKHPIMGNFEHDNLDWATIVDTVTKEIKNVEKLVNSHRWKVDLKVLVEGWHEKQIIIQYEGYGYAHQGQIRRGEAYAYILLLRTLKKNHKELHKSLDI